MEVKMNNKFYTAEQEKFALCMQFLSLLFMTQDKTDDAFIHGRYLHK